MFLRIFIIILLNLGYTYSWELSSWRTRNKSQQPMYKDMTKLLRVEDILKNKPPLVVSTEIDELKNNLVGVEKGDSFLFMGGDCAETYREHSTQNIINNYQLFILSTIILLNNSGKKIVKIARAAGQFSKPRSSEYEYVNNTEFYSYKGDMINGEDLSKREPNPELMIKAYTQSVETLNLIRALSSSYRFSNINVNDWKFDFKTEIYNKKPIEQLLTNLQNTINLLKGMDISNTDNMNTAKLYTGHEGMLLNYEEMLTRKDRFSDKYYDCSSHFVWIGERTRDINKAHVEFFKGISNPIGIKLSSNIHKYDLIRLLNILNPINESGKIILIIRMGDKIRNKLPELIEIVKLFGKKVTWVCDPMHANGKVANGVKTRYMYDIVKEIDEFFGIHRECGSIPGGIHLEMTANDVTECIGGKYIFNYDDTFLNKKYLTSCDPRLNFFQTVEIVEYVSKMI